MLTYASLRNGLWLGLAVCTASVAPAAWGKSVTEPAQATLSAEASAEVLQDQVQITLAAEVSGATQEQVSQTLNQRLQAALKQAKGHPGVDVQNGAYRIWSTNDRDGKISEWRGRAEILLQSRDFAAASRLAADLEPHVSIAGLVFSVSDGLRATQEQKLLSQSVAAFKQRAKALTQALGYIDYRLKTVDLGGSGAVPLSPAPQMMRAMVAGSAAVPLESGRERISVSVRGTIFLLPTQTAPAQ